MFRKPPMIKKATVLHSAGERKALKKRKTEIENKKKKDKKISKEDYSRAKSEYHKSDRNIKSMF